MLDGHWARRKGSGWLIALPPEVRHHLGVTHKIKLYWNLARLKEAALTTTPGRRAGRPNVTAMARELAQARETIESLKRRNEYRDRTLYAEGYAQGAIQARERLMHPTGPSARRGQRRRHWSIKRPVEAMPLPEPPSSAVVSGGADTSGPEEVPGVPQES
jgi:hypothetical protein